jgi:hypothetical protein
MLEKKKLRRNTKIDKTPKKTYGTFYHGHSHVKKLEQGIDGLVRGVRFDGHHFLGTFI